MEFSVFVDGFTSGFAAYHVVKDREASFRARFEKVPTYKREVEHYKANIGKVTSVDALVKDRRLLTVALSAFQLEGEIDKKAMIKKIITEDPNDKKSLANRLLDPRWKKFAAAFHSLAGDGGADIRKQASIDNVLAGYETNEFEKAVGESNESIREAMFFKRNAPGMTKPVDFLGNQVTAKVVRTVYGLPLAFSALDVKQQLSMLEKRGFDPAKLSNPKELDKFVDRYLSAADREAAGSTGGSPLLALFQSGSGLNLLV
jgi:hypothetical protein